MRDFWHWLHICLMLFALCGTAQASVAPYDAAAPLLPATMQNVRSTDTPPSPLKSGAESHKHPAFPGAEAHESSLASALSIHMGPLRRLQMKVPASAVPSMREPVLKAQSRHPFISDNAITVMLGMLWMVVFLILVYTVRHYCFTFNRLFGKQRHPYVDIDTADWPSVTVFIAAHNEEAVIAHSLSALLDVDYPADKLQIMPMNDRSSDRTREIIDDFVSRYPGRITPFHRSDGKPGKSAALKDATARVTTEILIVFDADYVPGRGLIKQLVAPFFDPETGAVMGRVVPLNTGSNLLTRLLDMERSGGYQVDQQARMNLHLVPQYGGTVGGVRHAALTAVGGWRDDALAEDTDLTYRLVLQGWKVVYQNRSECYEEVPESWPVRVRQIMRWAKGHNQAAFSYSAKLLTSRVVPLRERFDGLLLLGVYAMSPLLLLGWILAIILFYLNTTFWLGGVVGLFALMSYGALGNFAAFFEIAAAVYLDGSRGRIKLIPLNYFGFLVSLLSISRATFNQIVYDWLLKRKMVWDKTVRYRKDPVTT
jgi:cellulose synthase/poly-beta-1,6-N-acetylglucosamine synthase-like glycosyltransferase